MRFRGRGAYDDACEGHVHAPPKAAPKPKQAEFKLPVENLCDLVMAILMTMHIIACPFTKVEESFNMQAMHDLLVHGPDLASYDHLVFSGVVPRTFLGPLAVMLSGSGLIVPLRLFGPTMVASLDLQLACRMTLGLLAVMSLSALRRSTTRMLQCSSASVVITLVHVSQFHLMFYMSRPLANIFALILINFGCSQLMQHRPRSAVWFFASTAVIFRCDSILLTFPLLIGTVLCGKWGAGLFARLQAVVVAGVLATLGSLALTVMVDSVFWRRWVWPEGEVFLFNVVDDRSSEWGTSPWHWYASSALPRAMLGSLLLLPFGTRLTGLLPTAWSSSWQHRRLNASGYTLYTCSAVAFIVLYSLLPHKELRFIFPALPLLNGAAAIGFLRLMHGAQKNKLVLVACLGATAVLVLSAFVAMFFMYVSHFNYPGGQALLQFNELITPTPGAVVHVDNLAAISGVTRFIEPAIGVSKVENLAGLDYWERGFDYLIHPLAEVPGFSRLASVEGLVRVAFRSFPPGPIVEPMLHILQRNNTI